MGLQLLRCAMTPGENSTASGWIPVGLNLFAVSCGSGSSGELSTEASAEMIIKSSDYHDYLPTDYQVRGSLAVLVCMSLCHGIAEMQRRATEVLEMLKSCRERLQ